MEHHKSTKSALVAGGLGLAVAAAVGSLYYLCSKKPKKETKSSSIPIKELVKIINYTKYQYLPILEAISSTVRGAKEQLKYNEPFAEDTKMKSFKIVQQELKFLDKEVCKEYGVSYKDLKDSIQALENTEPIKTEIEKLNVAIEKALIGEKVSFESTEEIPKLTKAQYISIYKRILWSLRKLAYVQLRGKIRENNGKMRLQDKAEVEQMVVDAAGDVREEVCKKAGIKVNDKEEYYTVLQKCYFENIGDPEFTHILNEARNEHVFILRNILQGELIPEIEHIDIGAQSDEELDKVNKELIAKLGN